jgi:hypothetical protein
MSLIKRVAVNLLKFATDKNNLKVRRKKASWSTDYLYPLMVATAQDPSSDCPGVTQLIRSDVSVMHLHSW